MADRIVVSKEGLEKLRAELEHLQRVERPEISAAIAQARGLGDLSENAEYHAAKEKQALIEARISKLQHDLVRAEVIDPNQVAQGVVVFGRTVKVRDLGDGAEETYTLVGPHESDFDSGKISVDSPIGRGLLGKKPGDQVEIKVPAGTIRYQVLSLE
jgi:transcription elongation factor GreA